MLSRAAHGWTRQPKWTLTAEMGIWLTTPSGLFQYDQDNELFIPEVLPSTAPYFPFEVDADGAQVWSLSDSTAAYIDLFTGGRYAYTAADGLPPGRLSCLAFSEDYVWVGSDRGAARFDRLIEQWEYFSLDNPSWPEGSRQVARIVVMEDYVFIATAAGILRFDPATESFIRYGPSDGLRGGKCEDMWLLGDELWCFGEEGVDIYSTSQRNWTFLGLPQGFRSTKWRDIEKVDHSLYFLHEAGIDVCDISSRQIYPFDRENQLIGYDVCDITGTDDELWLATNRGLLRYQREDVQSGRAESWVLCDQSRGLTQHAVLRISAAGNNLFVSGESGLDVFDPKTEITITSLQFPEAGRKKEGLERGPKISWDEQGLVISPMPSWRGGLTGDYSYLTQTDGERVTERNWGRLQPFANHSSGRSASGLYDNTDPDEIFYGTTYRGNDGDLLRRVEGGNRVKFKQTYDPFFGQTTLRGGSAMLEAGPRSGAKKRSLLRSNWTFGEMITHSAREFFTGAQGPIYALQHQDLLIGSASVSLNGRILDEDEYTLNYTLGHFFFIFPGWELLNEGDRIEVSYQYRLDDEQIGETLTAGEMILSRGDALQVALSGFEKGQNSAITDTVWPTEDAGFRGGQLVTQARGHILGSEGQITTGGAFSEDFAGDQSASAGYVDGSVNRGPWTLDGKWLAISDSMATFEDRSTEFGFLRGEDAAGIRFEPSGQFWLESRTAETRGAYGSERTYHFAGQLSPFQGTSSFFAVDYFDALLDTLSRDRWIGFLGTETAFSPGFLRTLHLRSSRLQILARATEVHLDTLTDSTSNRTDLRTASLLTRWSIVPGPKVNFYPEVRWTTSQKAAGDGIFQADREELAPRGSLYSRDLIPGFTTYFNGEASYTQANFDLDENTRNVSLERQGIAQIDFAPGVYLPLMNPVSMRLYVARNAQDSLVGINEDLDLWDLGFRWRDYPSNVASQRYDSDAIQVTWVPSPSWLLYQSFSEIRSSGLPVEQLYSNRLEWKPNATDQLYWKYTLNRSLAPAGNELRHRPGVEWYRRWSSKTYTRGQFYVTLCDEPNLKSIELTPGGYLDHRFALPWKAGNATWRMDFSLGHLRQTLPAKEEKTSLGGYSRLDWSLRSYFTVRLRLDSSYVYSHTTASSELDWKLEVRLSARF